MTTADSQRVPWIGLVEAEVREPRPADIDADIAGAYLNFVCVCIDPGEYEQAAAEHVASQGWALVAVEDVEPVAARLARTKPARGVRKVIRLVEGDGVGRSADSWHLFPYEDAEG